MSQTAILGAGVMGETLLSGLVRAGRRVDQLLVGEKRPERAAELEERYGVAVVSNMEAAAKADTVALVVKPQDMADVLGEIADSLRPGQLLVSLAAGITTAFIESYVPAGVRLLRRRVDDRGRRPPRAAPHHRPRARRPDPGRVGRDAQGDRRAPH